jgi:hypothetical protein
LKERKNGALHKPLGGCEMRPTLGWTARCGIWREIKLTNPWAVAPEIYGTGKRFSMNSKYEVGVLPRVFLNMEMNVLGVL